MNNSFLFTFTLFVVFLQSCTQKDQPITQPNIIFIYTDDQREDALGIYENEVIQTPQLDKLAQQGVVFTNANVVFSLCSPSRAALLTGRYGSANGVLHLGSGLNEGEKTIAQHLKQAGYQTAMSGKWHLKQKPSDLGFDFSVYFQSNGTYYGRKVNDEGKTIHPENHCDEYCVERSIDFLEEAAKGNQPFFLFHCPQLPHMDHKHAWNAAKASLEKYNIDDMPIPASRLDDLGGKPEYLKTVRNLKQSKVYGYPEKQAIQQHTRDYYAIISEMDIFLGRLFETVNRLGLRENTYIFVMSDNGWILGEHGFTSKVLPYAPSAKVPLFVIGPDLKSRTEKRIALNIDMAPTILEMAGVKMPDEMHGQSLFPILQNKKTNWRTSFIYEGMGNYGGALPNLAAYDGTYRLIQTYQNETMKEVNFNELYDNREDPDELKNIYNDPEHADIVNKLLQEIANHKKNILNH